MKKSFMKNSSKLLALGLVLFLGACSTTKSIFLDKVKGKTIYLSETFPNDDSYMGTFSSQGQIYNDIYKLTTANNKNTATYENSKTKTIITFTTIDGKTGTYTMTIDGVIFGKPDMEIRLNW